MIVIDKELEITPYSGVCSFCNHFINGMECKAFKSIPLEIWNGDNKHLSPLPGQDNDIVFEVI